MNTIIERTNAQIKDKGSRLKQKADMMLKTIRCNQTGVPVIKSSQSNKGIYSGLFWAVAGITAITAAVAPYKPISLTICACAVIGGFTSRKNRKLSTQQTQRYSIGNTNQLTSQLLDVIQNVKDEWDSFMEQKKNTIQNLIMSMNFDDDLRSKLFSFTYVTESIQFPVSDIMAEMNKIEINSNFGTSFETIKNNIRMKLTSAIDVAVTNQIKKYEEIDSLIK